jgi:hypothetical protein
MEAATGIDLAGKIIERSEQLFAAGEGASNEGARALDEGPGRPTAAKISAGRG